MFDKIKNLRRVGKALALSFVIFQIAFSQIGFASAQTASQIPGGLKPDTSGAINVPQYDKGVDASIAQYLCVPESVDEGAALFQCISKVYRFGIAFGAIALVFFIVLAGYLYMAGGEASKEKGKTIFTTALTGMIIMLSSFVLLNFLNPSLTLIRPIQAPIFSAVDLPSCESIGFSGTCVLPSGQVSVGAGGGVPGSASEAAVAPLIAKYAKANGLTYCQLSSLVNKESSFITNNVSNGPPNRVDIKSTAKYYGLPFTNGSPPGHGIGLAQVYIYGPPPSKFWTNPNTPSRDGKEFGFNKPLTIPDLVDPDTALSAGAYFFASKVGKNKGDIGAAYAAYYGDPNQTKESTKKVVAKMLSMYAECEKKQK